MKPTHFPLHDRTIERWDDRERLAIADRIRDAERRVRCFIEQFDDARRSAPANAARGAERN